MLSRVLGPVFLSLALLSVPTHAAVKSTPERSSAPPRLYCMGDEVLTAIIENKVEMSDTTAMLTLKLNPGITCKMWSRNDLEFVKVSGLTVGDLFTVAYEEYSDGKNTWYRWDYSPVHRE